MFLCNLILLGPLGSGKTSLLRSLTGDPFRLVEPPSRRIDFAESYSILTDSLAWLPSSSSGLVYEDELVRIIVEDLLKHVQTISRLSSSSGVVGVGEGGGGVVLRQKRVSREGPPLPPPRQRSQSFTEVRGYICRELAESNAGNRLSGNLELLDSTEKLEMAGRPKLSHRRRNPLAKLLNRGFRPSRDHKKVQRHYSDSAKHAHYVVNAATPPSPLPPRASGSTPSPVPPPPTHSSPLPERVTEKIRQELGESVGGGSLPPKHLARLIDTPGHPSFRVLQSLFLTENSLCLLVFDTSKDILSPFSSSPSSSSFSSSSSAAHRQRPSPIAATPRPPSSPSSPSSPSPSSSPLDNSYLSHVMAVLSNVCLQWSGCKMDLTVCGPRVVLVGTHSDKAPSSVTHHNFKVLQEEIQASPYHRFVAGVKFVVSNSSIIERSSMDDLKRFVKETVKKTCRQQVPLKWLRCVRRFQGMPRKKSYFVSLAEARRLVSEICDISPADPEIGEVVHFLHQNQVIMHFPRVHHLKDLVVSSAQWFSRHLSALFGAGSVEVGPGDLPTGPAPGPTQEELLADQELLKSTGVLTNQLLDYVWREKESQAVKEELLVVMHKMDLLCCMASEAHPVTLSASVEDLTAEPDVRKKLKRSKRGGGGGASITSLVVPALVEEGEDLDHAHLAATMPSYDVDPIMFRFKDHVPDGLFPRLLVRCVQSYPRGFSLRQHSATFKVDDKSVLLLTEGRCYIRLALHPNTKLSSGGSPLSPPSPRPPSSSSPRPFLEYSDLDSVLSEGTPETCMAILMFVQASINDLTQQWTPHLDFDLCVKCNCKLRPAPIPMDAVVDIDAAVAEMSRGSGVGCGQRLATTYGSEHYIILNDVDSLLQQLSLRCEHGSQVSLAASLLCWFGEVTVSSASPASPALDNIGKHTY